MDDDTLSLLVLMGNAERVVAARGVDGVYRPFLLDRVARYSAEIDGQMERLRRRRLGALGELQFAAESNLGPRVGAVRAARQRLRFCERMLIRLARYRRELEERGAELRADERHRL